MALQDLSITEREIITRYLDNLELLNEERGDLQVIVFDGEEVSFSGGFIRESVEEEIGITDETKITVVTGEWLDQRHSTLFIHGNEEDVVSNSGWTNNGEWLEEKLLKGVYE